MSSDSKLSKRLVAAVTTVVFAGGAFVLSREAGRSASVFDQWKAPDCVVEGRVVGMDGRPLSGMVVEVVSVDGPEVALPSEPPTVITGSTGSFSVRVRRMGRGEILIRTRSQTGELLTEVARVAEHGRAWVEIRRPL